MKSKNNNRNSATESDLQVNDNVESAWVIKPLSRQERVTKANEVQDFVNAVKRRLGIDIENEY